MGLGTSPVTRLGTSLRASTKPQVSITRLSPVVKYTSVHLVLVNAASLDLDLHSLDIKNAYLYRDLDEEVYMKQPKGFEALGAESMVCHLHKAIYGLKQAGRQ
jgi:hypothetical protein